MPAYVVVQIEVRDPATYDHYKSMAPPSIAAHGGRYLVRGGQVDVLEGSWAPKRFVVLEFPSAEQARAWWSCSEYAGPKKLRQASADTQMILVEGVPEGFVPQ